MALEFEVSTGDTLQVGALKLLVAGIVTKIPGNVKIVGTFAPSIYIPLDSLDATELLGKGSRINYRRYFKNSEKENAEQLLTKLRPLINKHGLGYETVAYRKESLGSGFENLNRFFNLLGFMALMLGSAGVASSVHIYSKEKTGIVAILRCLGATGRVAFRVFLIQISLLGFAGSVVGAFLGHYIQLLIPLVMQDFLPVALDFEVSWTAIFEGILIGFVITYLFARLPLVSIKFVPPLAVLRSDISDNGKSTFARIKVSLLILIVCWLFALFQAESFTIGSFFYLGFLASIILFAIAAYILIWVIRKLFPFGANFILRQSLANLFRPNNQTVILMLVIGLGAFLISTISIVQNGILEQVNKISAETRSNMVLYDVQPDQKDTVEQLLTYHGITKNKEVPIVLLRLHKINGKSMNEIKADKKSEEIPEWILYMEHLATYRSKLTDSEEIISGVMQDSIRSSEDSIYISVTSITADQLKLKLGDEVIFNAQGLAIPTYVGSIRKVAWQQLHTNFSFLFPVGVLEKTPHFFAYLLHTPSADSNVRFKQDLAKDAPNISSVDLSLMIRTLDEVMDKVAFALKFMAMFCIVTGLMVLAGSVVNTKFVKMKENVLLRTIGALKKQLISIALLEYAYLGFFAGLCGILLSLVASWALTIYFLDLVFVPELTDMLQVLFGIMFLTIIVGSLNLRQIVNRSPLEILRKEQ
jgi:putative ABC transport system permease protein